MNSRIVSKDLKVGMFVIISEWLDEKSGDDHIVRQLSYSPLCFKAGEGQEETEGNKEVTDPRPWKPGGILPGMPE